MTKISFFRQEPLLQGFGYGLGFGMDVQLVVNIAQVGADGEGTQKKLFSNL